MANKFKVGDVVVRTGSEWGGLNPGDEGEVVYAAQNTIHLRDRFIAPNSPVYIRFSPAGFELAHPPKAGRKDDSGKLDFTLLDDMPHALEAVVEVMQWAVTKKLPEPYTRGSWQGVEPDRYRAALGRHDNAARKQAKDNDEPVRYQTDDETKLLHLAHIATSALFALESTIRELKGLK